MHIDESVAMHEHDPSWGERGQELCRSIEGVCGDLEVAVEHIGSTAVPGLASKPVIDVQVGAPIDHVAEVVARLSALGFTHVPDAGVEGREYLRRRGVEAANAHVVLKDGPLWNDNIVFRDYLQSHPDAAQRYERAKAVAADRHQRLLAYSAAKAAVLQEILAEAKRTAE